MRHLIRLSLFALAAGASAAGAAVPEDTPRIMVSGSGSVFTPPDVAVIAFTVHGEGDTPDAALRVLTAKQRAVEAGLRGLVEEPAKGGEIALREVRSRECRANNYGAPQLSTGACAVIGHVADLALEIRTRNVARAATAAGLIGRLGGTDPRVSAYLLADPGEAQRRAMAAALTDAKVRAQAIAAGAGVKLGALLSASDGGRIDDPEDIRVTAHRVVAAPPPPPPAPVPVDVTPRPIRTEARASVTYRIES